MYGCVRPVVAPHLVRAPFRMHSAMGAALPLSVDLRNTGLLASIRDQGASSSCEAHSGSAATESAFALMGDPLDFSPSEDDMYRGLRAVERARRTPIGGVLVPLQDDGGMTEDCLTYLGSFGVRPRRIAQTSDGRNSDVEIATVNAEPAFGDLELDVERLIVGPYAVDPGASDADHQMQAALASRIVVRVDTFVDGPFEDWTPSKPPIPPPNEADTRGGGHAMYIIGYAQGLYIVRSSWGTNCGDGGDFYASSAWLRAVWGLYPWTVRKA